MKVFYYMVGSRRIYIYHRYIDNDVHLADCVFIDKSDNRECYEWLKNKIEQTNVRREGSLEI